MSLRLSNTQLAFVLSAFGYPYIVFQVFGGWLGDRVGPRRTLFRVRADLGGSHDSHRLRRQPHVAVPRPAHARRRRGRDLPRRHARDAGLDGAASPRVRPGHYARLRAPRQRADAADRGVADRHRDLARLVRRARVREPAVGRGVGLVFPRRPGGASRDHAGRTRARCRIGGRQPTSGRAARFRCRGDGSPRACGPSRSSTSVTAGRCGCISTGCRRTSCTSTTCSSAARRSSRRQCSRRALAAITSAAWSATRSCDGPAMSGRPDAGSCCWAFLGVVRVRAANFLDARSDDRRHQPGGRVLLRRDRHRADVGDPDGHRTAVLGNGERIHEHRIGARGGAVAAGVRIHHRRDRQLEPAVRRFDGPPARRRGAGVHRCIRSARSNSDSLARAASARQP